MGENFNIADITIFKRCIKNMNSSKFEKKKDEKIWYLTDEKFPLGMKRINTKLKGETKHEYWIYKYILKTN